MNLFKAVVTFFSLDINTTLDHMKDKLNKQIEEDDLQGYPTYPSTEDIYGKYQKERNINPEDPSKIKDHSGLHKKSQNNEEEFSESMSGDDLDIPGSELDDDLEINGDEDEENHYYSLGGDNHNDLEEDYN